MNPSARYFYRSQSKKGVEGGFMAEILLEAESRTEKGKAVKRLRKAGFIPAVIYGDGKTGESVKLNLKSFTQAMKGHLLSNLIVTIKFNNQKDKKDAKALIRDVQMDFLKDTVMHVDFQEVSMTKKIRTKVPIESVGESIGVTQQGGVMEFSLRELEIECLPLNIPEAISIDVSGLALGQSFHVRDIQVPEGVTILTNKDITVFSVVMQKMEEEKPAEGEITEPEVIGKKKEPAEGEAAAAGEKKEPEGKEAEKGEKKEEKKKEK